MLLLERLSDQEGMGSLLLLLVKKRADLFHSKVPRKTQRQVQVSQGIP